MKLIWIVYQCQGQDKELIEYYNYILEFKNFM